jgi:uncharacterized membrane protein HdeD (DUF308 family)
MTSLDELMIVWRSQDAAPLHGVNETLLRLALRQDEAKLKAQRRTEEWVTYLTSALLIVAMGFFCLIMIYNDDDVIVGWDFVIPIVGGAAALLMGFALYVTRRAQAQREQRFGESLRDQLGRHIAQLDYQATRAVRLASVLVIAIFVGATAILLASMRVNSEPNEPFDDWESVASGILVCVFGSVVSVWAARHSVKRDVLPRKQRLEALLKELDGQ